MKIKIVATITGSPDHLTSRVYEAGSEYTVGTVDMPEFLAETLLKEAYAEEVGNTVLLEENAPTTVSEAKKAIPATVPGYPRKYEKKKT